MKKLFSIAALIVVAKFCFAQKLQKGNLLGLHVMTVTLKPGVTMDQFTTFYVTKLIPVYEKQFDGAKGFLVKGRRGGSQDKLGVLWFFETEQARDKYFNKDGLTEIGKAAAAKTEDVQKELEKLGTYTDEAYTDWIV